MSDLKLNKTEPARTPSYADGSSTPCESVSRPDPAQTKVPSQLVRQYLQQLSQQQGQLPDLMAQKQQTLLRQLTQLLESQASSQAPQETTGTASGASVAATQLSSPQPLQQLLQRLLPLLSANDPLLKQPLAQRGNEVILLRQLAQSPQLLSTLLQQLPPALQESSASGRALMQWLVQSITLRLAPEKMPQNLITQLQQQQVFLTMTPPDKRSLQNLEHLNRATLQFIQQSQSTVNQGSELATLSGRPSTPSGEAKTEASPNSKLQSGNLRPEIATIKAISAETLESLSTSYHAAEGTETNPDSKPQTAPARTKIVTAKIISAEKLVQGLSTSDHAAEGTETNPDSKPQITPARPEIATIKVISSEKLVQGLSTSDHAAEGTETNPDSKPQIAPARPEIATIKVISSEKIVQSLSTSDHAAEGTETNPDSKPQATPARAEIVTAKIISTDKLAQQLPVLGSATEDLAVEAEATAPNRDAGPTKGAASSTALPNGEPKPTAAPPTPPDPGIKNRVQTTAHAATSVDATQKVNAAAIAPNEPDNKLAIGLSSKIEATLTVDKHGAPVAQATADATKEQPTAPKATTTKVERQPILQRMAALLHAFPGAVEQASGSTLDPAPNPPLIPNRMSLGSFVHEIHLHLAGRQLPDPLKPALKNLVDALAQPLTQPDAVEQWFDFLRQPLSSDSTAGRALQQWALTLLSIRLQQMAATTDPTSSAQQQPHSLLNHEEHQQLTHKLAASLFGQTERFQQLQQDAQQQLPNYVPLPPQQPGDREGGLSMQRSAGKQSPYQWTLSFFIELPQLGPLQIRACLDVPDIQLQVMAERLSAVDKIKETLPLLEGRFRELGLTPGGFVCRQGKIIPPQTEDEISSASPTAGVSIRI